ncbi:hypothetical protein MASR2M15_18720 [Anaerolineales bacterium]
MKLTSPTVLIFNSKSRLPQFLRALVVVAVGGILMLVISRLDLQPAPGALLGMIAGFIALSGLLAGILLLLAMRHDQALTIEVDEAGFMIKRPDKKDQRVLWEDVQFYTIEHSADIFNIDSFFGGARPSQSIDEGIFGCLFGLSLGLYLLLLEAFIGGATREVHLKAKTRAYVKVKGSGDAMNTFIDTVLPTYLPDKKQADKKAKAAGTAK